MILKKLNNFSPSGALVRPARAQGGDERARDQFAFLSVIPNCLQCYFREPFFQIAEGDAEFLANNTFIIFQLGRVAFYGVR